MGNSTKVSLLENLARAQQGCFQARVGLFDTPIGVAAKAKGL